ncbi:hypothetical protein OEZ86_005260 [Tetradesmus obliquus]|nr:hypothetical protein OEZ86_005260 [Tetradesmus obliquus]
MKDAAHNKQTPSIGCGCSSCKCSATKKPNFVFILVDDQDKSYNSSHPRYQPALHKYLRTQGTEFENHYVTTPVCCPSRTNILFGKYSHNTNMTDVFPPAGGYTKWLAAGLNHGPYLPKYLQGAGYNTYYAGKFLVEYALYNYRPVPEGWTDFDAAIHPWVFRYEYPVFARNGGQPTLYAGQYHTDVVASKARAQIQSAKKAGKPFYIQVAPIGCHDACYVDEDFNGYLTPPLPAPRHAKLYAEVNLPLRPNHNEEDVSDKPAWLQAVPRLDAANVTYLNEYYRERLRSLRAVDELVEAVVKELEAVGELDNTYIIYTGDNGYHLGAHRLGAGKETPYQEDIQVPFLIRGPGIQAGKVSTTPTAHEDILPTILSLAGISLPSDLDGQPLPLPLSNSKEAKEVQYEQPKNKFEQHLTEYWGLFADQLAAGELSRITNFTWKAVSVHTPEQNYKYVVWCSGDREFYDRSVDQFELVNSAKSADPRLLDRLDALLSALAHAKAGQLTNPWPTIHPDNSVTSFAQALNPKHDDFYRQLPKFKFLSCLDHYDIENELSPFYHSSQQRQQLEAAAAAAPPLDFAKLRQQRLLQYKEAVADGWARQEKLGQPEYTVNFKAAESAPGVNFNVKPGTVLAGVEAHAVPLPAAEFERFRRYKADMVDEAKYYRLKSMA